MQTVYKYPLAISDYPKVEMPRGARVLTAAEQNGFLCIWALVDPLETEMEKREFRLAGTGHPIEEPSLRYVSTVILYRGELVFHLFEITSTEDTR